MPGNRTKERRKCRPGQGPFEKCPGNRTGAAVRDFTVPLCALGVQSRSFSDIPKKRVPFVASGWTESGGGMFIDRAVRTAKLLALVSLLATLTWAQQPPQMSSFERARALDMLQVISSDVKKHYYDPKFHGVDWDPRVAEA